MTEPLLLGVRHHGPGSARAVRRALAAYRPEVVLIEGPPEADELTRLVDDRMRPPVALLAYPVAGPADGVRSALFWPTAEFSPEWQAIRWAVGYGVPVRFCDLPAAHKLAQPHGEPDSDAVRVDPIGALAAAAGYDDPERCGKEFARVAVVCGAWHVPALARAVPAAHDAKALRGLPKIKTAVTWVPWTHGRLANWQGYGAGVTSPGWYHHLFTAPDRPVTRWLVEVAGVLRAEGVPASSAHVLEAVRLAEALATLRGRPLAGLAEVTEATRAVLCDGDELRLDLVNRKLVVGERLGEVPEDATSVPLAKDLAAAQRRWKLPPSALVSDHDLDLRKEFDLERSRLLHRLRLLGVDWGQPREDGSARRGKGTFWESWRLCWRPEFAVDLVEASAYGTTVPAAATAKSVELTGAAGSLGEVTALVERCLLADLPAALPAVLRALDEKVALDADVTHLMTALPALARSLRYGDVRGTDLSALRVVTTGLVIRVCLGLPGAVTALDDDAAREMRDQLDAVHGALSLLDDAELSGRWLDTLRRLVERTDLPGVIGGRLTRLLLDGGQLDNSDVGRRMALVLTIGVPPARAASWIEGFLAGGGLLLIHDERLLSLVDAWLVGIPADTFVEVLPLLRRTFGAFTQPERRAIGERIRSSGGGAPARPDPGVDPDRAARVLPTVALLLGRSPKDLEVAV